MDKHIVSMQFFMVFFTCIATSIRFLWDISKEEEDKLNIKNENDLFIFTILFLAVNSIAMLHFLITTIMPQIKLREPMVKEKG